MYKKYIEKADITREVARGVGYIMGLM